MSRQDTIDKYSYLIGQKINKWTVLDIVYDRAKPDAICSCECGNTTKPVNLRTLLVGASKDCGCGRKQMLRDTRTKNLVGQRFGKLIAVELLDESSKNHNRQYRCKCDCGNYIVTTSINLTQGETRSCGCLTSYYNSYIAKLLTDLQEEFTQEYPVYIDNKRFRFDFYIPKYNLMIEYDGEQHFVPMRYHKDHTKNIEALKKRQKYDQLKTEYCEKNNINLLRIPYYEKENIDSIIVNCLQRLSEEDVTDNGAYATV